MSYSAFSTNSLTESEGELIAEAYFRGSRDPEKIRKILDVEHFDVNLLKHPLVKKFIVEKRLEIVQEYTLSEHLTFLKKIRDTAFNDDQLKLALTSEVALGKAAGLYEPKGLPDPNEGSTDASKLSTEDLRKRLANVSKALAAPVHSDVPEDPPVEDPSDPNFMEEDRYSDEDVGEI